MSVWLTGGPFSINVGGVESMNLDIKTRTHTHSVHTLSYQSLSTTLRCISCVSQSHTGTANYSHISVMEMRTCQGAKIRELWECVRETVGLKRLEVGEHDSLASWASWWCVIRVYSRAYVVSTARGCRFITPRRQIAEVLWFTVSEGLKETSEGAVHGGEAKTG